MDHRGRGDATSHWQLAFVVGAVTAGLLWAGPGDVMAQTRTNPPATTQDRNGQKVATALQVNPAGESGAGSK
jgi:hypothetical protein